MYALALKGKTSPDLLTVLSSSFTTQGLRIRPSGIKEMMPTKVILQMADKPLILGRPFLATSRALIDMESGELMLRIHDKCLILNIYKSMHSSSGAKTCMKINSVDPASTKPPERSGKTIGNNSQDKELAEDFCPSPSQQKKEAAISPMPTEEEKKKKEPVAYMPKPPSHKG
ncbi:hypothetical protein PIB30_075980 [Stylosanthes scabra]|uniref:Reverse transcriptase domain-containing protein n=1 Tax=Stylosanthes scabra TaxID=79078 RepID=A0ABU6TRJ2_9FABA|nr:hypothetical protein [Stylosanthes scabra]